MLRRHSLPLFLIGIAAVGYVVIISSFF